MTGSQIVSADTAALDAALRTTTDAAARVELHRRAAEVVDLPPERRFHLTQAWIYALVSGQGEVADALEQELRTLGGL